MGNPGKTQAVHREKTEMFDSVYVYLQQITKGFQETHSVAKQKYTNELQIK